MKIVRGGDKRGKPRQAEFREGKSETNSAKAQRRSQWYWLRKDRWIWYLGELHNYSYTGVNWTGLRNTYELKQYRQ